MGIGFGMGKKAWFSKSVTASQSEFIISVKTDNTGTSNNDQFTLPMTEGTYDVDWGDTNVDLSQTGAKTHTYSSSGTYEIKVTGGTRMYFNYGGDGDKMLEIKNWGEATWASLGLFKSFTGCANLIMTATDIPDLSLVTDARECFSIDALFTADSSIGSWNTSNFTNMKQFFYFSPLFNEDISGWDLTNVTTIQLMFGGATAFNQPIGAWDTSNVTNMSTVFEDADSFDQDISSWSVSQATTLFNFMRNTTGLSTANYDALLIAWDAQGAMSYSGTVNFGGSKYTSGGAAETARTSLIAKWGAITDGGAA